MAKILNEDGFVRHELPPELLDFLSNHGKHVKAFAELCDRKAMEAPYRAADYRLSKQSSADTWKGALWVLDLCGYKWAENPDGSLTFTMR